MAYEFEGVQYGKLRDMQEARRLGTCSCLRKD